MIEIDKREYGKSSHSQKSFIVELMRPTFLIILIPSLIFLAEVIVMILLSLFPPMSVVNEALLDSSMLILFIFPALYFLILKPIRIYLTEHRSDAKDQKELRNKLKDALNEIRALQRLMPVCRKCGKIRNDREYFMQVEKYIQAHPKFALTGALCSECDKGSDTK